MICISVTVMLNIVPCAFWPYICLPGRSVYLNLLPIFWLGCLGGFVFVFFFNIELLYFYTSCFLQFVGCLFILFMVSFVGQKLLGLIRSHLFVYVFLKSSNIDRPRDYCTKWSQRKTNIYRLYMESTKWFKWT